jgi:hypothetical protein
MLNSITNYTNTASVYSAQTSIHSVPKSQKQIQTASVSLDVYQRADGSEATRDGIAEPVEESIEETPAANDEKRFRELLHQFVGQTLFGQMLKSMRATQEKNPYFHGGRAEEIFQGQLDMELTDSMTKATSKTLSEPMYKLMKAPKVPA